MILPCKRHCNERSEKSDATYPIRQVKVTQHHILLLNGMTIPWLSHWPKIVQQSLYFFDNNSSMKPIAMYNYIRNFLSPKKSHCKVFLLCTEANKFDCLIDLLNAVHLDPPLLFVAVAPMFISVSGTSTPQSCSSWATSEVCVPLPTLSLCTYLPYHRLLLSGSKVLRGHMVSAKTTWSFSSHILSYTLSWAQL